mgnify:CR=1 FL=1
MQVRMIHHLGLLSTFWESYTIPTEHKQQHVNVMDGTTGGLWPPSRNFTTPVPVANFFIVVGDGRNMQLTSVSEAAILNSDYQSTSGNVGSVTDESGLYTIEGGWR